MSFSAGGSERLAAGSFCFEFNLLLLAGGHAGFTGSLVFGTQPADQAALLLGGALVVEGDEELEEFLFELLRGIVTGGETVSESLALGEILPALRFEDGGVEVVVDLANSSFSWCRTAGNPERSTDALSSPTTPVSFQRELCAFST